MRHWRGPFDRQGYHHGNLKEALIEAAQRFIAERGHRRVHPGRCGQARGRDAGGALPPFPRPRSPGGRGRLPRLRRAGRAPRAGPARATARRSSASPAWARPIWPSPSRSPASTPPCSRPSQPRARPCGPFWAKAVESGGKPAGNAFDFLVKALSETFPEGFKGVDVRFIAIEVWALSHGIATLDAAGQLPEGPGPAGQVRTPARRRPRPRPRRPQGQTR